MVDKNGLISLAKIIAVKYNLIPSLVCGICEQESSWNPDANRYESAFYVRYIEPLIDAGTLTDMAEARNRATSWGLMQVMGEVAREMGYFGNLPFDSPEDGIKWGCEKFARCVAESYGDMISALLRYNGGTDYSYPKSVISKSAMYGS